MNSLTPNLVPRSDMVLSIFLCTIFIGFGYCVKNDRYDEPKLGKLLLQFSVCTIYPRRTDKTRYPREEMI